MTNERETVLHHLSRARRALLANDCKRAARELDTLPGGHSPDMIQAANHAGIGDRDRALGWLDGCIRAHGGRIGTPIETVHNGRYRADFDPENVRGALLVITRPRGGGVMVWNEAAAEWADHIRTAIDGGEADALCRAILAE